MLPLSCETLKFEQVSQYVLVITLNRPEVRNAINSKMMEELLSVWRELTTNPKELRCIILTGAGQAFCAGADLKERNNISLEVWRKQRSVLEQAMIALIECPLPIIAAVNGAAFGGGLELTLACDFAYAANAATFAQSEVKVGLIPGAMGTQHLSRATGIRRARELTFTGESFSAEQAYHWGIINKLCAPEKIMEEALTTANHIADNAPLAILQAKKAINMSQSLDPKSGYEFEIEAYNQVLSTKDRAEGIAAFNEKRKPKFKGE